MLTAVYDFELEKKMIESNKVIERNDGTVKKYWKYIALIIYFS